MAVDFNKFSDERKQSFLKDQCYQFLWDAPLSVTEEIYEYLSANFKTSQERRKEAKVKATKAKKR
mgnify:CR=1 FL=1